MQLLREELPDDELRPRGRPKNPLPAAPLPPKTKLIAEPYWFPHEGLVRADSTALLLVDMQQDCRFILHSFPIISIISVHRVKLCDTNVLVDAVV